MNASRGVISVDVMLYDQQHLPRYSWQGLFEDSSDLFGRLTLNGCPWFVRVPAPDWSLHSNPAQ